MMLVPETEDVFAHVPPRLNVLYLESVLSRSRKRDVAFVGCTMTNRCAHN